jgi:2-keto-3-deoxy-L-rhamnonate aldolase RhmA
MGDGMPLVENAAKRKMQAGGVALGFGVHHLRTSAVPMLAKASGHDWIFIDTEHGAFSVQEATQLCIAALPVGVTPIVRVCAGALDEGTRALDNGALGIVVPHVDTAKEARRIAEAFHYPPDGHRSWGGPPAVYGYQPPAVAEAQKALNQEILIVAMIESPEAVENADAIAAVDGIDVLLMGTSDLTAEMGISGQIGHSRVIEAYQAIIDAARRHGKFSGMGGVYDQENARRYIAMGAQFILSGADHSYVMAGAKARTDFLKTIEIAPTTEKSPAETKKKNKGNKK